MSSRPVWSTEKVPDQQELHSETLSQEKKYIYIYGICDDLYMLGPSGTIRRHSLVGVAVSLWVWALRPSS